MAKTKKEEEKTVIEKKEKEVVVDTDSIKEEVMAYVDSQIDWRLEKVIGERVKKEILDEVDKANRRVIREKNRKILFKNIFLILFLGIIGLLLYLLYQESYFDQYFNHSSKKNKEEVVEKINTEEEKKEEEKGPTLEDYIKKYGSYLDSYVLNNSSYNEDFYEGRLTDEVKNAISLQTMDFEQFTVEDDYHVIDAENVLKVCNQLFDKCNKKSFEYNGDKVRYFQKLDSYVTNSILKKSDSTIVREIVNIQEDKDTVVITTVEGILEEDVYYSVSPREEICDAYEGAMMEHQDEFNKVVYTFNHKKLVQVEKG